MRVGEQMAAYSQGNCSWDSLRVCEHFKDACESGPFTLRVFLHKFNDLHYLESQFSVEIIPQEGYDVCSILILIKNIPVFSPHW